jgi:hypothetical protein
MRVSVIFETLHRVKIKRASQQGQALDLAQLRDQICDAFWTKSTGINPPDANNVASLYGEGAWEKQEMISPTP